MKEVLLEGLLVAALGAAFAFAANGISPRGLKLTRNYFPGEEIPGVPVLRATGPRSGSGTNSLAASGSEELAARLKAKGLQLLEGAEVEKLFRDPRYEQGQIIFLDARNSQHYQEGHIPGAYEFDHYHALDYLPAILPLCQSAQQIIVYCSGGDCEDSQFAAITLRDDVQ